MKMPFRNLWAEFKAFAFQGNMIELAVAVVIGAAFSNVIHAMVTDIINPSIGHVVQAVRAAKEKTTEAAERVTHTVGLTPATHPVPAATPPAVPPPTTLPVDPTVAALAQQIKAALAAPAPPPAPPAPAPGEQAAIIMKTIPAIKARSGRKPDRHMRGKWVRKARKSSLLRGSSGMTFWPETPLFRPTSQWAYKMLERRWLRKVRIVSERCRI